MNGHRIIGQGGDLQSIMQLRRLVTQALELQKIQEERLGKLLDEMDAWLHNEDGLMITDVIEWRDQLAAALERPAFGHEEQRIVGFDLASGPDGSAYRCGCGEFYNSPEAALECLKGHRGV